MFKYVNWTLRRKVNANINWDNIGCCKEETKKLARKTNPEIKTSNNKSQMQMIENKNKKQDTKQRKNIKKKLLKTVQQQYNNRS